MVNLPEDYEDRTTPTGALTELPATTSRGINAITGQVNDNTSSLTTKYDKPVTGIPSTDLANSVQTSLAKANSAAPQTYVDTQLANVYTKAEVDAKLAATGQQNPDPPYDLSITAFQPATTRAASSAGDNPFGPITLQRAVTVTAVTFKCATADASGNTVAELRKNGTTVSGSSTTMNPTEQLAGKTTTGSWSFAVGDVLSVYDTAVGTTPGKGLYAGLKAVTTASQFSTSPVFTGTGTLSATVTQTVPPPIFAGDGAFTAVAYDPPVSVAVPSGAAAGQIAVVFIAADPAGASTPTVTSAPSGFAAAPGTPVIEAGVGTTMVLFAYWKRLTGADTGTYDFTLSGTAGASPRRTARAVLYAGCVSSGSPFDVTGSATSNYPSTTAPTIASVTTTADSELLVYVGSAYTPTVSPNPPTGFTIDSQNTLAANTESIWIASKQQLALGPTGSLPATWTSSTNEAMIAYLFALKPSGGVAVTLTPTLTGISPNPGSSGQTITLTGTHFNVSTPTVTFGGTAATSVTVVNANTLTCVAPTKPNGTVSVVVTTTSGASNSMSFLYSAPVSGGPGPGYFTQFSASGPLQTDVFFPIMAWTSYAPANFLISPYNTSGLGQALADAGFNTLYADFGWFNSAQYPTYGVPHATAAHAAGLKLIIHYQNVDWFLTENPSFAGDVIGWFQGDEQDMNRAGYHDANSAWATSNAYLAQRAHEPTRPIYNNYGKAYGCYITRTFAMNGAGGFDTGSETGDLQLYLQACDVPSVDTYWWTDDFEATTGAWMYGGNIDNVRRFQTNTAQPIYGFVESSREQGNLAPTADQMEQAIWSMIIHGARGIAYFNDDMATDGTQAGFYGVWFQTYYDRTGGDAIIARMKVINPRLTGLAPVLNSTQLGTVNSAGREICTSYVTVSSTGGIPVDVMVRHYGSNSYLFAQASGDSTHQLSGNTTASFTWVAGGTKTVTVRDESRSRSMTSGVFTDTFTPYQTHIYVIPD